MESKMKKFIIKLLFSPRQRSSELGSALGLTKRSNIVRPFPAAAQPAQARRRPVGLAKTWIYAASFAAGMLLAGCDTDDEYRAAEPELYLTASTRIFALSADGGQRTVVIDTNCGEWKVTTDAAGWLSNRKEGNLLTITAGESLSTKAQTAVVTVSSIDDPSLTCEIRVMQYGTGATNLSALGTANCYMASTGASYVFDASIKEEYGYGIYDNVFTTADIERMLNEGRVAKADGSRPRRIAFLHCVGSRDEKVCQQHCSKVCCITGVKQAMEMKQLFPEADVFNFYMDIRMFGPGYEEMYRDAQQRLNIHFVRGRISEASPTLDGRVQIKAEDTLTGRPLKMSVDMLVLIVGMRSNASNARFAAGAGLGVQPSGFLAPRDAFLHNVESGVDGIFYAGAVTAPKNIGESLSEAVVAADRAAEYLKRA